MRRIVLSLAVSVFGCGGGDGNAPTPDGGADIGIDAGDLGSFAVPPHSCGYECPNDGTCAEKRDGYLCPALGAWNQIPHDDPCPKWDGKQPAVALGKCIASAPSGEAVKYTGVDSDGTKILPDGRRVKAMGKEHAFIEKDRPGQLPSVIARIPGKRWVVTVDTGYGPHAVRTIDVDKIGTTDPTLGVVRFDPPKTLGSGITFVAPDLLYVATSNGDVQAIKIDPITGALSLDDTRTVRLPMGKKGIWFTSTVAASPDGKRLLVAPILEKSVLVFDIEAGSSSFGTQTATIDIGAGEAFGSAFDPNDKAGRHAYVTLWQSRAVAEIDVFDGKLLRTFPTDKDPQGIAFLDARWMAVANAFGDTISLVDRVAGTSTPVPVDTDKNMHGFDPSSLAYDSVNKRLYATLAGLNATSSWDVDVTATPPKLTPLGRIPTGWWPGAVTTLDDGTVVIANMRAAFDGPDNQKFMIHDGDVMGRTYASVQAVPFPSNADLAAGEAAVKSSIEVKNLAGSPKVDCGGAPYDFPIPATNTEGPSKQIQHVIFVVRENKTFDALFGDLPGVNGKPEYILGKDSAQQEKVWRNVRALAKTFTHGDNYYTDAELSQQGHFWTVYGRSSDYNERTWAVDGYTRDIRHTPYPSGGVVDVGQPQEGSSFDWLASHDIGYEIMGEALGLPHVKLKEGPNPLDSNYPGGFIQSIGYPDVEKACYLAGRARVLCDLRSFAYVTLPNDHTKGVSPKSPSPDSMIAMNDEATGMLVDGISNSPLWASTLIVITEDDPAVGGEHVDIHRTPLVLISPWVKRGYVTKTHFDVSSLHKIFAHVFGLPYPNVQVANASIPYDAFTSTPDYTPFVHLKRQWLLGCGDKSTAIEQMMTKSFDLDRVDESPGLDRQVERWMKGQQLESLPPAEEAKVRAKILAKAQREEGAPLHGGASTPEADDDD